MRLLGSCPGALCPGSGDGKAWGVLWVISGTAGCGAEGCRRALSPALDWGSGSLRAASFTNRLFCVAQPELLFRELGHLSRERTSPTSSSVSPRRNFSVSLRPWTDSCGSDDQVWALSVPWRRQRNGSLALKKTPLPL